MIANINNPLSLKFYPIGQNGKEFSSRYHFITQEIKNNIKNMCLIQNHILLHLLKGGRSSFFNFASNVFFIIDKI